MFSDAVPLPVTYHCNSRQHSLDLGDHDYDAFERVLTVTAHQDALMACYYMDHCDNNVEITEVYEVEEMDGVPSTTIITDITEVDNYPIDIETYTELQAISQNGNGEIIVN